MTKKMSAKSSGQVGKTAAKPVAKIVAKTAGKGDGKIADKSPGKTTKVRVSTPVVAKKSAVSKGAVSKKVVKKAVVKAGGATRTSKAGTSKAATAKVAARAVGKTATTASAPTAPPRLVIEAPTGPVDPYFRPQLSADELRKIKSGLKKKDLAYFRGLLVERRTEILGDVASMDQSRAAQAGDLSHMPLHMADVGSDNYEQEATLGLMEFERKMLREIEDALLRIDAGIYGVCMESGIPIPRIRLEAKPWAKYTIEVALERERLGLQP